MISSSINFYGLMNFFPDPSSSSSSSSSPPPPRPSSRLEFGAKNCEDREQPTSSLDLNKTASHVKEVRCSWIFPKMENGPKTVKDVKLISAGKILENNRTVAECRSPLCDAPDAVTTMHVVIQPHKEREKRVASEPQQNKCGCVIL
ncbi:membrane-anchored ubiquitin-fold protein 1 isoform X1 [Carica papaya]|uniref:membrane-anchored ubiquitin-fold protein 1 isoform X1 n=1 Tax=Carica papaya TaxID=3649 RepID=UPI000B8CA288|nr:membrane-anchored ubiquitin-fold protein 1 isoform X1 [Carica papaya]